MSDAEKHEPMSEGDISVIACICHEANRAYCEQIGEAMQPEWKDAPKEIQDSSRNGVRLFFSNPEITQKQLHENWVDYKLKAGWTYGKEKDPVRKTHPCLVAYEDLPAEQKTKDALFQAVCRACDHMRKNPPSFQE